MAFGALLLSLFWLTSPAAAQLVLHGDGSISTGTPQCSDGEDNDGDSMIDILDPECFYDGVYTPGWNQENMQRLSGATTGISSCGSGGAQAALILPLVWLYGRRRSRKA